MSYYDDDDVEIEIITPGRSERKTEFVSNTLYGKTNSRGTVNNPKNQDTLKKMQSRDEQFYRWVKSLNPTADVTKETHNFTVSNYTIDGKTRKKTSDL